MPNRALFVAFALSLACLGSAAPLSAAQTGPVAAIPSDPIAGIVEAFKTHDVVALGEGNHNNLQSAAFRLSLYRDPRFQAVVRDIVVESGNARHQAIMDRYIAGEDVPEKELRKAWLETTQSNSIWDVPIYAEAFRVIREINRGLPPDRKLRVLLGDDPYPAAGGGVERTETFPASVVQKEALARNHKALIIFGDIHFLRRGGLDPAGSIVNHLEKGGAKVFSIWTSTPSRDDLTVLQPAVGGWPKPSLTMLKGTILGAAPFAFHFPGPMGDEVGGTLEEQFDALLYLGPKAELTFDQLSPTLCADPDYVAMRAARMSTMRPANGRNRGDIFKEQCGGAAAREDKARLP